LCRLGTCHFGAFMQVDRLWSWRKARKSNPSQLRLSCDTLQLSLAWLRWQLNRPSHGSLGEAAGLGLPWVLAVGKALTEEVKGDASRCAELPNYLNDEA
jgi:hypothetical protein